jgi:hypothetical protein
MWGRLLPAVDEHRNGAAADLFSPRRDRATVAREVIA